MDSSNLKIFSELAHSRKTTSRFLGDRQTASRERLVLLLYGFPFSANTITFTYHPLFELFFHRSYLKTTTEVHLQWPIRAVRKDWKNGKSMGDSKQSKWQHCCDKLEYWEESWWPEETCCHSVSSIRPSAIAGVKNLQGVKYQSFHKD